MYKVNDKVRCYGETFKVIHVQYYKGHGAYKAMHPSHSGLYLISGRQGREWRYGCELELVL